MQLLENDKNGLKALTSSNSQQLPQ